MIMVAIFLPLFIGIAALAIDIGHLYTTRSELQNVADAAALAGARYIGDQYLNDPNRYENGFTKEEILEVVNEVAKKNKASNVEIEIEEDPKEGILIGNWVPSVSVEDVGKLIDITTDPVTFNVGVENLDSPDAVRVIARRTDDSVNSAVVNFFSSIFGIDTSNITSRKAIAALSGPANLEPGVVKAPFAVSEHFFPKYCDKDQKIQLSPSDSSGIGACAAWHGYGPDHPTGGNSPGSINNKILAIINGDTPTWGEDDTPEDPLKYPGGYTKGDVWLDEIFGYNTNNVFEAPAVSSGDLWYLTNGEVAETFIHSNVAVLEEGEIEDPNVDYYDGNDGDVEGTPVNKPASIIAMYDYFRYRDDDENNDTWTTTVPIYQETGDGCNPPHGLRTIIGFAEIIIYKVEGNPSRLIEAYVNCDFKVIEGKGWGGQFGNLKGSYPTLVK